MLRAICLSLLAALAVACGDSASKGNCEKLLDHMVKLETRATGGEGLGGDQAKDLEGQQKELKETLRKEFMDQCTERTPGSFVDCALDKKAVTELADCDRR